jgi:hypothetical protein
MPTFKQILANRRNAEKSCGAITGRVAVLPRENQETFDQLFEQFVEDEKPVGSVELELVRKMAKHTWLRERAAPSF